MGLCIRQPNPAAWLFPYKCTPRNDAKKLNERYSVTDISIKDLFIVVLTVESLWDLRKCVSTVILMLELNINTVT